MGKSLQVYEGEGIVVTFDPNVCIHSAVCVSSLPVVFDVSEKRWVRPEKAAVADVVAVVAKCPSGALRAVQAGVAPAKVGSGTGTEVTVKPNGPLLVKGGVKVTKENGEVVEKETCAFCRCGGTKNAPFCDGTHNTIGFKSPS